MTSVPRDYDHLCAVVCAALSADKSHTQRMRILADLIWQHYHDQGVSWVGFYIDHPDEPDDRRLVLGPHRDKPACSPIGLHGACGQALVSKQIMIVRDVRELGPNYIACDPRDRSEIVVPLIDETGRCWAVLDVDSWDVDMFDESDSRGLRDVLVSAELLHWPVRA
jgi:putative methionine-R-sulfoxide reductase with GAF domain